MKTDCFISMIAYKLVLLALKNGYNVVSPVIAQAINESGWGTSSLADVYNYFGMKANDRWKGEFVTKETWEQKPNGTKYTTTAKFRKYNSLKEGLSGYYEFISIDRYEPLRKAKTSSEYCDKLKECGYATSLVYPDTLKKIISQYNLQKYDTLLQILKGEN